MSSIVYEGSPLDEYLKDSGHDEAHVAVEAPTTDEVSPAGPSPHWDWQSASLALLDALPDELITLLFPPAPEGPGSSASNDMTERWKYTVCSSSLLDSSLPRADPPRPPLSDDDRPAHLPPTDPLYPTGCPTSSAAETSSRASHGLWYLAALPVALIVPSPAWLRLAMLVLALAVWTGMAMLGDALRIREEEASRQRKADEQPSAQCRAIDSLKQLVAEAEDLDGVVNAALMEIEEAGDAESSPTVSFLSLRQSLDFNLLSLTSLVSDVSINTHPLTSTFELSILTAMYGLNPKTSTRPLSPTFPTSFDALQSSPHPHATPASSTPQTRFVSPPHSRTGSFNFDPEDPLPARVLFTALPPRTPRASKRATWTGAAPTGLASPRSPALSSSSHTMLLPSPLFSTLDDALPYALPIEPLPSTCQQLAVSEPRSEPMAKRRSLQSITYIHPTSPQPASRSPRSDRPVSLSPPGSPTAAPVQLRLAFEPAAVESEESSELGYLASHPPPTLDSGAPPVRCRTPLSAAFPLVRTTSNPTTSLGNAFQLASRRPTRLPLHRPHSSLSSLPPPTDPLSGSHFLSSPLIRSSSLASPLIAIDSDPPSPLSKAHLLCSFLSFHSRRRHALVTFLALRRDLAPYQWADVEDSAQTLIDGFRDAREELERELRLARANWGGGSARGAKDDAAAGWAPKPKSRADERKESVESLSEGVSALAAKVRALEGLLGGRWEKGWEGLREEVGEIVRVWERGRGEEAKVARGLGLGAARPRAFTALEENADDADDDGEAEDRGSMNEDEERRDDVALHLLLSQSLEPIGREQVFAASTSTPLLPAPSRAPPSTTPRAERIRLAKLERAAASDLSHSRRPTVRDSMGDVVCELKGLMGHLRAIKGSVLPPSDHSIPEGDEDEDEGAQDDGDSFSHGSLSSSNRDSASSGASTDSSFSVESTSSPPASPQPTGRLALPPPPHRTSLPALSSGSSDGDEYDLDGFLGELHGFLSTDRLHALGSGGSDITLHGSKLDEGQVAGHAQT